MVRLRVKMLRSSSVNCNNIMNGVFGEQKKHPVECSCAANGSVSEKRYLLTKARHLAYANYNSIKNHSRSQYSRLSNLVIGNSILASSRCSIICRRCRFCLT